MWFKEQMKLTHSYFQSTIQPHKGIFSCHKCYKAEKLNAYQGECDPVRKIQQRGLP